MSQSVLQPAELIAAMVSPPGRGNPYPLYEEMRTHGNLIQVKPGLVAALGYAECDRALREPHLRVQDSHSYDRIYPRWREHSSLRGYTDSMLYHNPPDHARMRRLVSGGFTPRRVTALEPAIEQMTDRLLDGMAEIGADGSAVDFISEFASRLPIAVISALLGVPESDHVWFRAVAADLTLALEGINNISGLGPADAAMDNLSTYLDDLIDHRRHRPGSDIISALVQAYYTDDDRLSHEELVGNMMLLLTAGFETTTFLLGHGLLLAIEHPGFAARLREEPGFAAGYVEELLRFEPPVQGTTRWAAADVDLSGMTVPAGSKVIVMLAAGNRDPRRFDHPQRFDPDRTDVQPLTFGAGAHFCLGSPLARMEARIALPRLLRRFPQMSLAGPPIRRETWVGRGLDSLPVALEGGIMRALRRPSVGAVTSTSEAGRGELITAYLKRLGVDHQGEPSLAGLRALHRAHVERVPYEVLEIQLGRPTTVDPQDVIPRILQGRGGYCVQLNSAFATLLSALGYRVTWHRAWVQTGATPLPPGVPSAPHLATTVEIEGQLWLVDVGLGDGLHDPLPLRAGSYRQGPFTFRMSPSQTEVGGWRFDHDLRGSIAGLDFSLSPAVQDDFATWHPFLSTSPESRLVRTVTVMRRDAVSTDSLVGCMLRRFDGAGKTVRELTTAQEWYAALADVFGLDLPDVDAGERAALWARVHSVHQAWLSARAQRAS